MDSTMCKYFSNEDVTGWHNDVYDHPSYQCFCTKSGKKRELLLPEKQCKRCLEKGLNTNIE